jgi:hypothetical protein
MKPLYSSSEPVAGLIANGKPSSFMARASAAMKELAAKEDVRSFPST